MKIFNVMKRSILAAFALVVALSFLAHTVSAASPTCTNTKANKQLVSVKRKSVTCGLIQNNQYPKPGGG
jgi:hypothetical protein